MHNVLLHHTFCSHYAPLAYVHAHALMCSMCHSVEHELGHCSISPAGLDGQTVPPQQWLVLCTACPITAAALHTFATVGDYSSSSSSSSTSSKLKRRSSSDPAAAAAAVAAAAAAAVKDLKDATTAGNTAGQQRTVAELKVQEVCLPYHIITCCCTVRCQSAQQQPLWQYQAYLCASQHTLTSKYLYHAPWL
jgi:hypothetical protein